MNRTGRDLGARISLAYRPAVVDAVARVLDEQDMAGGGSRWDDIDPPGWQSRDALRAAYRHMAIEVLAVAMPYIRKDPS